MPLWLRRLPPLFLIFVLLMGTSPPAAGQDYPTYSIGDFWEYSVEARLDTLLGLGNVSGDLTAEGDARAEVTAVTGGDATITWTGDLMLQGRFMLPGETTEAGLSGTIETTYEERRSDPYFLPVATSSQTILDLTITFIVSVPYTATLELNATIPATGGAPTYPLEEGERTFGTAAQLATNLTFEFLGMDFQNRTEEEVLSVIRWSVAPAPVVEVPAGLFSGLHVTLEPLSGFVPSPLQALVPGTVQVTHHAPSVGSPVLYQFLADGVEVGKASLESYASASTAPPPFWLNPLFIGGILAVPVALLLVRYWRERRRGL
ncbi:MAG: hypothetical protein ACE5I4_06625 [Thermoplasmata archaeon]